MHFSTILYFQVNHKPSKPRLLKKLRINVASTGRYIEVGLLPKDGGFITAMIVVSDGDFLLLNDAEAANFFTAIRDAPKFKKIHGREEYCADVLAGKSGLFKITERSSTVFDVCFEKDEDEFSIPWLYADIVILLEKEQFINDQMQRAGEEIDECVDELERLLIAAKRNLVGNPFIEPLLRYEADTSCWNVGKPFAFFQRGSAQVHPR